MVDYKTLRVPEEAYEHAKKAKRDGETWGEYLRRCSDNPPEIKKFVEAGATNTVQLEATEYTKIAREVAEELR